MELKYLSQNHFPLKKQNNSYQTHVHKMVVIKRDKQVSCLPRFFVIQFFQSIQPFFIIIPVFSCLQFGFLEPPSK